MNRPTAQLPTMTTFVVRFWREWSAGETRWRGRVEHVASGRRKDFLQLEDMFDFFECFGVGLPGHQSRIIQVDTRSSSE
ncbi:MAG: hypothetical protein U9R25_07315 [Chloroflexota bacterium]|nr:hypothetical protein [Chloroflexota bacterium]